MVVLSEEERNNEWYNSLDTNGGARALVSEEIIHQAMLPVCLSIYTSVLN
jgi:hypothetical protein